MTDENQTITQAIVEDTPSIDPNKKAMRISLFSSSGEPLGLEGASAINSTLDGLTAGAAEPITEEDTILSALAKLQAQIDAL